MCERRGVDVESINVYLDQSRTPLPLLTSETSWLGGRHIRIRGKYYFNVQCWLLLGNWKHVVYGMKLIVNILFCFSAKDESKSPVRTSGRLSVTAPPSRKTSTANNVSSASKFYIRYDFLLIWYIDVWNKLMVANENFWYFFRAIEVNRGFLLPLQVEGQTKTI